MRRFQDQQAPSTPPIRIRNKKSIDEAMHMKSLSDASYGGIAA
jgi:hypothetical protein